MRHISCQVDKTRVAYIRHRHHHRRRRRRRRHRHRHRRHHHHHHHHNNNHHHNHHCHHDWARTNGLAPTGSFNSTVG